MSNSDWHRWNGEKVECVRKHCVAFDNKLVFQL